VPILRGSGKRALNLREHLADRLARERVLGWQADRYPRPAIVRVEYPPHHDTLVKECSRELGMRYSGLKKYRVAAPAEARIEDGRTAIDLVNDGDVTTVTVDGVFVGTGREPVVDGLDLDKAGIASSAEAGIQVDDFLRTTNPNVYAAGDVCLEHKFTTTAYASGRLVVRNALFPGRKRMNSQRIPWCTYTDPEIAHVGLYVKQARERDIRVKTFTVPMHDVDRAVIDSEESGFVKIHVRDGSDKILGATIVARHAGEMINEISLAMAAGIGLRKLAQVMRAYPTQAEAIRMAADNYNESRLTPVRRRLLRMWFHR
jgi:pyruvate/2-oxoglutarate dehydrogenase complex dihydrolipoamide dehydrogenase (E3) component